ncbi:MAG: hydrogenase maturation nickel metallochaperone HypA/HybF [Candidatus Hodarchaeales archaeon]|jgi:hydrogenase nickel incorporation protein HypA/HybF
MHEIALAKSVQETVISVAMKNNGTSIKKIILKFGLFALIQEDQFRFCFDIIKKDSNLTIDTELEVIWTKGELKCLECGFFGEVKDVPQDHSELVPIFKCPKCEKYATEIISGLETSIDSIVVE